MATIITKTLVVEKTENVINPRGSGPTIGQEIDNWLMYSIKSGAVPHSVIVEITDEDAKQMKECTLITGDERKPRSKACPK